MRRLLIILSLLAAGAAARAAAPSLLAAFERELAAIAERATPVVVRVSRQNPAPPTPYGMPGGWSGAFPGGSSFSGWPGFSPPLYDAAQTWMPAVTGFLWDREGHVATAALPNGQGDLRAAPSNVAEKPAAVRGLAGDVNLYVLDAAPAPAAPLPIGDSKALKPGAALIVVAAFPDGDVGPYPCVLSGITPGEPARFRLSGVPGASAAGAPVLNRQGELVAIVLDSRFQPGNTGLAMPMHVARPVIERLVGAPPQGYLGVSAGELDRGTAARLGVQEGAGVVVHPGTVAGSARVPGLQVNDVITALDGKAVRSTSEYDAAQRSLEAGKPATLSVLRKGERLAVTVTPGRLPL